VQNGTENNTVVIDSVDVDQVIKANIDMVRDVQYRYGDYVIMSSENHITCAVNVLKAIAMKYYNLSFFTIIQPV
jgi:hypothetical protein